MAVTIKDIAEKVNTSVATVSRVINNKGYISEEKRIAVEKAIKELNYTPQRVHSSAAKQIKTIGLIIPDMYNLYYIPVLHGLDDELSTHNFNLFLCNSHENIEKEKKYLNNLIVKEVDGIIVLGTRPITGTNKHIIAISKKLPTLVINDYIFGSQVCSVMTDEAEGTYRAINYLIQLGHRKIAFINGDVDYTTYRYKQEGYEKALHDHHIHINPAFLVKEDPHEEGGYLGASKLLKAKERPTAIFTASDQIAIGVIKPFMSTSYVFQKIFP